MLQSLNNDNKKYKHYRIPQLTLEIIMYKAFRTYVHLTTY